MKTTRLALISVGLSLLLACSDEAALCEEPCDEADDCAGGYTCMAVGEPSQRQCVPESCLQCEGRACRISTPTDGQCSFWGCE